MTVYEWVFGTPYFLLGVIAVFVALGVDAVLSYGERLRSERDARIAERRARLYGKGKR